jgi:hypothetical protein
MKKTILILSVLLAFKITANCQQFGEFSASIIIEDSIGNRDSVIIGHYYDASFGIDTALGEQDLYGLEYDSLEIRSIHRLSDTGDCIVSYYSIQDDFIGNFDLKKDFRDPSEVFESLEFYFKIKAKHYPIKLYTDFSQMFENSDYNAWSRLWNHKFDCSMVNTGECEPYKNHFVHEITDSTYSYISLLLSFESKIEKTPTNNISLFPNPANDILHISQDKPLNGTLKIIYFTGNLVFEKELNGINDISINISGLESGCYIIEIKQDENTNRYKVIKY